MRLIERDAGLAVERCERGFCGDRVTLWLETGWTVKLHLYWPERRHIMTLSRLRWHDQVGWVIDAVSDDAEPMRCFAWRITVVLPRA
ncbi:MAG: hypothetical protein HZB15_04315 [Actinobacteria bacterium]|nr:hypothetical protein [Actinomycetota bacterium]